MGVSQLQYAADSDALVKIYINDISGTVTDVPLKKLVQVATYQETFTNPILYSKLRQQALAFVPMQNGHPNAWKQFELISYKKNEGNMVSFSRGSSLTKVFEATFTEDANEYVMGEDNDRTTLHIYCKFIHRDSRRIRASASNTAFRERNRLFKRVQQFFFNKSVELMDRKSIQRNRETIIQSTENVMDAIITQATQVSLLLSSQGARAYEALNKSIHHRQEYPSFQRTSSHDRFNIDMDDAEEAQGVEIVFGPKDSASPSDWKVFFEPKIVDIDCACSLSDGILVDSTAPDVVIIDSIAPKIVDIDCACSLSDGTLVDSTAPDVVIIDSIAPGVVKSCSSGNLSYESDDSFVGLSVSDDDDVSWALLEDDE